MCTKPRNYIIINSYFFGYLAFTKHIYVGNATLTTTAGLSTFAFLPSVCLFLHSSVLAKPRLLHSWPRSVILNQAPRNHSEAGIATLRMLLESETPAIGRHFASILRPTPPYLGVLPADFRGCLERHWAAFIEMNSRGRCSPTSKYIIYLSNYLSNYPQGDLQVSNSESHGEHFASFSTLSSYN